jgi:hypothetical protein
MKLNIFTRIELLFWDFAIQTLSHSGATRLFVKRASTLVSDTDSAALAVLIALSGVVGLVSGYLFYFVVANIR